MDAVRRLLTHPATIRTCQVLIGLIFTTASLGKLGDLQAFAEQVHNFKLLPVAVENLVALTLPWIELVAGFALIFGVRPRSGGVVVSFLMVMFTIGVLIAMARGLDIECGCFGTADGTRVGLIKVLENTVMLVLGLAASVRPR
jgi:uncharacterized membrane protein YphA (DoxX/SURF4 family)